MNLLKISHQRGSSLHFLGCSSMPNIEPLDFKTESLVRSLNPEVSFSQAVEAALEIGYPCERADS